MNSAGRFHSRFLQLTLNTVAIYSAIWAAPIPLLLCQLSPNPSHIELFMAKSLDIEVKDEKKQSWFPSLRSSCPLFPTVPFFLLAFLHFQPQPLPVASDNLCAGSAREKNRGLALPLLTPDLSLAAEPLGDNFDGHILSWRQPF